MTSRWLAIIVLVMIASLFVAGCTNTTSPSPSPTPTPTPTSLKAFVAAYHARFEQEKNVNHGLFVFEQWNETWINDTAMNVHYRFGENGSTVGQYNDTIQRFATIADASEFVKSKCAGWRQNSDSKYLNLFIESDDFNHTTGRDPTVSFYCNNTVNANNSSVGYSYFQLEDIVIYSVVTPDLNIR